MYLNSEIRWHCIRSVPVSTFLCLVNNFNNLIRAYILMSCCIYQTGRKFSLEFKFRYFANGKFAALLELRRNQLNMLERKY